ncbi:major facilitator superfamily domain-containing protein [Colletotrichum lupini]|nr:major facilitator superfamily domain-containing protein [Colletotrichum lupini]
MQSFQNCTVENLALFATILLCSNLQYRTDFELTPDLAGLNVTILYVGCVFAVPFAGFVLDKLGRRRGLMVGSAIALLGAILQASAQEKVQLLLGRFLLGISFIITGTGAPSWLMEVGPPKYREEITNAMVACLPITGMVGGIIYLGVYNKTSNWAWRAGLMV